MSDTFSTPIATDVAAAPAAPVSPAERIQVLDVIRGVAVLGILLMNIPGFGGPPGVGHDPVSFGHHSRLNIGFWVPIMVLFEGKMRGAFSMLFGASTLLLTDRAEARGLGAKVGEIFARRNLWLVLFGILHGYFLWYGDILYWYGVTALLFLFPFRSATPRLLWICGLVSLSFVFIPMQSEISEQLEQANSVQAARQAQRLGKPLTTSQSKALQEERSDAEKRIKDREETIRHMRGKYWDITQYRAEVVQSIHTDIFYFFGFGDPLGMMLIGMALLRSGFLTGSRPNGTYFRVAAICFSILIFVAGFGALRVVQSGFAPLTTALFLTIPLELTRLPGTLANISVVILVWKSGWLKPLTRSLAAVGRMALSNYILTSVLCALYFYGYGLKQYATLEFFQLYYVVAVVWFVLIAFSVVWLRYFQFGPVEWLWRSLTYWKRQPFLKRHPDSLTLEATAPAATT